MEPRKHYRNLSMRTFNLPILVIAFSLAALGCATSASAQTKIQCIQTQLGQFEAPLAWQNTLGASRANAMCTDAAIATTTPASKRYQTSGAQPLVQTARYITYDGEKVSTALARWAQSDGYQMVWNAPMQVDLPLNAGDINASGFLDAVGKLVGGVNAKILGKRGEVGIDSKYLFPIEAFVYSDKVVSIALKQ